MLEKSLASYPLYPVRKSVILSSNRGAAVIVIIITGPSADLRPTGLDWIGDSGYSLGTWAPGTSRCSAGVWNRWATLFCGFIQFSYIIRISITIWIIIQIFMGSASQMGLEPVLREEKNMAIFLTTFRKM